MENKNVIKQSIYELYEVMQEIAGTKGGKQLLSPQICHRLRFNLEEVKACLEPEVVEWVEVPVQEATETEVQTVKKAESKTKKIVEKPTSWAATLQDREQVKAYYQEEMYKLFDPKVEKAVKDRLQRKLTINDLKYLYSILSPVEIQGRRVKKDLLQLFKDYFDAEARTEGMNKKLRGR